MLDVVARSQRGRICEYRSNDTSVRTPTVIRTVESEVPDSMYILIQNGKRIFRSAGRSIELDPYLLTPESSDMHIGPTSNNGVTVIRLPFSGDEEIHPDTEVVVIANAYELRKDARRLVKAIIGIRSKVGHNVLLCAPGLADSSNIALLSYMGIDVFDDSVARAFGSNGILSIPEGAVVMSEDMTDRNLSVLDDENSKIHQFIQGARLRELVDQRAPSSPLSVATLRIFDDVGHGYQSETCSTVGCRFACNTTQSLMRPEVLCYRRTIMDRYLKPANKRVLLLLPCSAKKPYHTSKTHKRFASAIHTAGHDVLVHEVIVTSPLGIVPRELDVFFPANSYDIPVTGQWKCEERGFIREMLSKLLEQGYDSVISHLGEDTDLIRGLCDIKETVVGDPTSPASLTNLDAALREATKGMAGAGDYKTDRKETVRSILTFQFGKGIADSILDEDTSVIGKFPYWKIMRSDVQLGMLSAERGMVSMTMDGARILAEHNHHVIEMTDFELKGSLFAVGVVKADPNIREGDEAVITLNGEVKGVGVAAMSGNEMVDLKRGIAVKVRHKLK